MQLEGVDLSQTSFKGRLPLRKDFFLKIPPLWSFFCKPWFSDMGEHFSSFFCHIFPSCWSFWHYTGQHLSSWPKGLFAQNVTMLTRSQDMQLGHKASLYLILGKEVCTLRTHVYMSMHNYWDMATSVEVSLSLFRWNF